VRIDSIPTSPRYLASLLEVVSSKADVIGYRWNGKTGTNYSTEPNYTPIESQVPLGTVLVKMRTDRLKGTRNSVVP